LDAAVYAETFSQVFGVQWSYTKHVVYPPKTFTCVLRSSSILASKY